MFTVNHEEGKNSFDVLPPGEYECVISKLEKKTFSSGNDGLNVTLTVRDDVEQEGRKRKIFDTLVQTEKAMFKFQNYFYAVGIPNGTKLETLDDVIKVLTLKPVRAKVRIEKYQKDGETREQNRIATLMPAQAEYIPADPEADNPFDLAEYAPMVDDDNLPF